MTRAKLIAALASCDNKRDRNPPRKHGNIPAADRREGAHRQPRRDRRARHPRVPRDGLGTVAVYSDCDRRALHVRLADEAYHHRRRVRRARATCASNASSTSRGDRGATLVHPGYGFLAENEDFAQACVDAGLTFVGPTPQAIALMGSKTAARDGGDRAPACPSCPAPTRRSTTTRTDAAIVAAEADADRLSAGREGRGGRRRQGHAHGRDAEPICSPAIRVARSEAGSAFGDAAVYLERRLIEPAAHRDPAARRRARHGAAVRRARVLDSAAAPEGRGGVAVAGARRRHAARDGRVRGARSHARSATPTPARSSSCSTQTGAFYFLEMNTRLQVEHPVTEMVTGIDLVQWQLRIALGERLTISPEQALTPRAHAIECRIYAEDPDRGFMPSPGLVRALSGARRARHPRRPRRGAGLRDPGLLRLDDREAHRLGRHRATRRSRGSRACSTSTASSACRTTVPFFRWLVRPAGVPSRQLRHDLSRRAARRPQGTAVRRADRRRRATTPRSSPRWRRGSWPTAPRRRDPTARPARGAGPSRTGGLRPS